MSAPTIDQIMLGIEARLKTIEGLRTSDVAPDQINPPSAIVGVPDIPEYRTTFRRGRWTITPTVTIATSAAVDRIGQRELALYASPEGPKSIVAAIEGDRTLGGLVEECYVASFRPLGTLEVGVLGYYGGLFQLTVVAPGGTSA